MIGSRYNGKKTAVLDVLRRYRSQRGTTEDGVDLEFLNLRAGAIENGQYLLAIVGETKAGKSTLINALLGERILPTDVLQSSSAIVEIFKSEKKYVEVQYADGHTETVYDDLSTPDIDEAFEHLRRIGALQDRFRGIPTTLIDACIVQGSIKPGYPIPVDELQAASKLPLAGKDTLIEEYVKGRTLAHIPVEIRFGFPLKYGFDELRLVDSPGVNALGGVQDRTFAYLHKANAVLFVHSLEGPIEKSSFREFITQVVPNRTRQSLFLVLSKSGLKSDIEIDEKVKEARSLFGEEFEQRRILHVDSMLKIVADELQGFESASALKVHYADRKRYFEQRYQGERRQEWRDEAVNFDTKLKLLNNTLESLTLDADRETVRTAIRSFSNFDEMELLIDEFSTRAPELQLSELLQVVRRGYENQVKAFAQNIDLLKKKRKHPQTFENEISEIQRLLGEYQHELNQFSTLMEKRHSGVSAESRSDIEELKEKFIKIITQATSESAQCKAVLDFNEEGRNLVNSVTDRIRKECDEKLAELGTEYKTSHNVTVPVIDVASLAEQAKRNAYEKVRREVGDTSGRNAFIGAGSGAALGAAIGTAFLPGIGTLLGGFFGSLFGGGGGAATGQKIFKEENVFSEKMARVKFREVAIKQIIEVSENAIPSILSTFLDDHLAAFKAAIKKLITSRRVELEEIKTRKTANDEILKEINSEEQKKKVVDTELKSIHEMLEDLRWTV